MEPEIIGERRVIEIINALIGEKRNVCLIGPGGTGKSYTIREVYDRLTLSGVCVHKTSTTGVSAISIKGVTLHRWAGCGIMQGTVEEIYEKFLRYNKLTRTRWLETDILIIDEISMLGQELLEKLDKIAKLITGKNVVFGGIQVFLIGDFMQIPPVKDTYCFKSNLWPEFKFKYFKFTHAFRYNNKEYYNTLLRIRVGSPSEADLKLLSSRHKAYKKLIREGTFNTRNYTYMFSTNRQADIHNVKEMAKIDRNEHIYNAVDKFYPNDEFAKKRGKLTTKEFETYSDMMDGVIPRKTVLKKDALVMLRVNVDINEELANGSQGHVRGCKHKCNVDGVWFKDRVCIKFLNGKKEWIEPYNYELVVLNKGRFVRTQVPLIVCFGATIHKFQSTTLNNAVVDMGKSIFEDNQGYVALSRTRDPSNLYLSEYSTSSIKTNMEALTFDEAVSKVATCL